MFDSTQRHYGTSPRDFISEISQADVRIGARNIRLSAARNSARARHRSPDDRTLQFCARTRRDGDRLTQAAARCRVVEHDHSTLTHTALKGIHAGKLVDGSTGGVSQTGSLCCGGRRLSPLPDSEEVWPHRSVAGFGNSRCRVRPKRSTGYKNTAP